MEAMKTPLKALLLGLLGLAVFCLIAPVVPGPVASPSCYQNGVAGYVTQTQFNKDGSTWIWVCDGQQASPTDPQHCISAVTTSPVIDNPCVAPPHDGLQLPGSVKRAAWMRQRECNQ